MVSCAAPSQACFNEHGSFFCLVLNEALLRVPWHLRVCLLHIAGLNISQKQAVCCNKEALARLSATVPLRPSLFSHLLVQPLHDQNTP